MPETDMTIKEPEAIEVECGELCSLRNGTVWGQKATAMLVARVPYRAIVEDAAREGVKIHPGTLSRHARHIPALRPVVPPVAVAVKATNIEILETIIQKGFANAANWKPTISDTMKAMDQWFRLTAGNPFDELLDALASAAIEDEEAALDITDPSLGDVDEMSPDDDTES